MALLLPLQPPYSFSSSSQVRCLRKGLFFAPSSSITSSSCSSSLNPQVIVTLERGKKNKIIKSLLGPSLCLCRSSLTPPNQKRKRTKYRKQYPGESIGITEEMRFVAMRLRNDVNGKKLEEEDEAWRPSMEGLLKYLVNTKLVFDTIERIVDESEDVSYAYFRRTGLERCESLERDLQWFTSQNFEVPEPCNIGVSYAKYLEEEARENAPLFLSHFYTIYFSHIAGGQVLVRQVSEKLLGGKELELNRWEGDAQDLLRGVREKLNLLGEHWTRDEKNKCLKETAKAFKYMGQIVRLIIL